MVTYIPAPIESTAIMVGIAESSPHLSISFLITEPCLKDLFSIYYDSYILKHSSLYFEANNCCTRICCSRTHFPKIRFQKTCCPKTCCKKTSCRKTCCLKTHCPLFKDALSKDPLPKIRCPRNRCLKTLCRRTQRIKFEFKN